MNFRRELFSDIYESEMRALTEKHWEEVAYYKDIPLSVDVETYYRLESLGNLRLYTWRADGGKLMGYQLFIVRQGLHYMGSKQAQQDVIWIEPSVRGSGWRFIDWCDHQLAGEKVQTVMQHMKAKLPFGKTLERLGYDLQDIIYTRRLDKTIKDYGAEDRSAHEGGE